MASDQSWNKVGDATSLHPSDPPPCANGCGFFGSAASMNLCSKCYRDFQADAANNLHKSLIQKSIPAGSSGESVGLRPLQGAASASNACDASAVASCGDEAPKKPSRCGTCKKRVGLTGFACRCGMTFCGVHRYPEMHECAFDFKGAGRDAIAKANPLIKADKVVDRI